MVMGEESPRSPEAKVGMQVEDLWDIQEPQLSPTEKLNACFESIPVSAFPPAPLHQGIEIRSDSSLAEAVQILAEHKILSAPVVDVDAPDHSSWIDRYIGIVEFAGIAVWILHQSEPPSPRSRSGGNALAAATNGAISPLEQQVLGPESAAATPGSFFESLTSSELYKSTQYKMKSIPVVDLGEGKIENIITQSAVIHMLAECAGLQWFERWGTKTVSELGLPMMSPASIVKVYEDEPVLQAFKLMRKKRVGGIPVIEKGGRAVGNISLRDIHFLLTAPEIYHDYRSITARNFLTAVRDYLEKHEESSPMLSNMITCKKDNTIKDLILMLDSKKIHRVYVVDDDGNLEGVITLRDIISRFVVRNYLKAQC